MKYYPGEILNLKMDLNIRFNHEIELNEEELKDFIELSIQHFVNDPDLVKLFKETNPKKLQVSDPGEETSTSESPD